MRVTGTSMVLRALLRQRRKLLLAGISIALGVGYLAGTLGLLDRIGAGLDQLASATADDADVVLEGEVAYESSIESVRRLIPAELASTVEGVEGVASVSHRLEDVALIIGPDGEPVAAPGLSEQPLGINWPEDPQVANLEILDGSAPGSDDEVVIDARSAQEVGAGVGDDVRIAGKGRVGDYRVSGIVETDGAGRSDGSSLVALTTDEARRVFDRPTDDNRIAIRVAQGGEVDSVMAQLRSLVPPTVEVVDGRTAALHAQESLTRSFTLVRVLVTSFGVLALFVGMVTVANSLTLLHSQRRRMFAGFRLVGARRSQLRRAALAEAVVLALVSCVVGIPLGVLIALFIEWALGSLGTAVPTAGPVLGPSAAGLATLVGVLATVAAAWRPVRSACSVPPIEAVAEVPPPQRKRHSLVGVSAARALVVAVAVAGAALIASAEPWLIVALSLGAAAVVFLAGFVGVALTAAVSSVMRILPFRPAPLRLVAARDSRRNPRRTAATTAAVLLAVAVVSGLAVFLASFTASVDGAVDDLVTADLVVDSETFTRGGLPADLTEQLAYVDGVEAVSAWQLGRGSVDGVAVRMTGLDGDAATEVVDPGFVGDPPRGITETSGWISASLAERTGLGVGDRLGLTFYSGGFEDLEVSAVYRGGAGLLGDVVIDGDVLTRQIPATPDLFALVRTDGRSSTADAVREVSASYGVPAVSTPEQFVGERGELLRGFERVVLWMLMFTLLQALVGVVNTLVLSVGERRREFGLLRVAGASRRDVSKMVLFEGVSFSSVGTLLGVAVGTGAAAAAVVLLRTLGLGVFTVPVITLGAIAAASVVVGVLAAWLPARMAASVPPLDAVLELGTEHAPVRAAVAERAPVPQRAVAPVRRAPATAAPVAPPPFDPMRIGAPLPAALAASHPAAHVPGVHGPSPVPPEHIGQVLSVAVLDGSSVVTLRGDSPEARALVALYAMADAPSGVVAASGAIAAAGDLAVFAELSFEPAGGLEEQPLAEATSTSAPAPTDERTPTLESAIGALLGDQLFGTGDHGAAGDPDISKPAAVGGVDPVADGPSGPVEPSTPTGDLWEQPPPEAPRERRRGLRRSRRTDPTDRRPRRRSRRQPLAGPAEGWVAGTSSPAGGQAGPSQEVPTSGFVGGPTGAPSVSERTVPGAHEQPVGLGRAVERLDETTRQRWAAVLHSMNAALASGELVGPLVCGKVRAEAAAVTRTDRRLLVVAQRSDRMAVESLHPVLTGVVLRPGPAGTLVVVLFDRGRQLEITDVRDVREAEALVLRDALPPDTAEPSNGDQSVSPALADRMAAPAPQRPEAEGFVRRV